MKAVVLEIKNGVAAALREDGVVVKTRQSCEVGDTIELQSETLRFPTRKKRWMRTAIAAVLALVITGGSLGYTTATAYSYVSIDTEESSLELSVNRLGRVIGVRAVDEESEELASDLRGDLRHMRVEDALDHTMEFLHRREQPPEGNWPVLCGVTGGDDRRASELNEALERCAGRDDLEGIHLYMMDVSRNERQEALQSDLSGGRYAFDRRGGVPDHAPQGTEHLPPPGQPLFPPPREPKL
ncbi:MAG: hypothetical protein II379_06025 [Oscillospiraceae bacterium]|nr:hypothetical protein [Oscillospiraceae bacterium]